RLLWLDASVAAGFLEYYTGSAGKLRNRSVTTATAGG
ncbi:unnamed protein product, partial [marine sediment metagenome]